MVKMITGCLALIALCCSTANAGLITQVRMDAAGPGLHTSMTPAYSISRTITPLFGSVTNNGAAGFTANGLSIFNVTYTVTGTGGFGGFFDAGKAGTNPQFFTTNGSTAGVFDGFQFDFSSSGTGTVSVGANTQTFGAGTNSFEFRDFLASPTISSVTFSVVQNVGGTFTFNSVSAVPEATSLLMVGSAVVGLVSMRRRKKLV